MPEMPSSTLAPLAAEDWPDSLADLRSGFAGALNVYRVMAHDAPLLRAWVPLRAHVVRESALGPDRLEVVILRIAHRLKSPYEHAHHVARATEIGFTQDRIARLSGPLADMPEEDRLLASAVDEILDDARLTSDTLTGLMTALGTEGTLDLMATVGFYLTLGAIANSFEVPLDDSLAAPRG